MSITQPIRNLEDVRDLCNYYLNLGQHRNHRLVVFSLYTALRISDLLPLRWQDVYNFKIKRARETFTVTEKKTGKTKIIAINRKIAATLERAAASSCPDEFLFSNPKTSKSISRSQAYRIIRFAGENLNIPGRISCHSLRKTFGYHAWKNGVSPAVIMEIYNHSSLNHTRRYLGIQQDDLNAVYMGMGY
ncbi:MAG: tyrosine-type recombinase/integrase [Defluviitaleaceae bacterium]|nr:tyrosine-type recombinase/integrase [Defluviitaleaceae bacterium]